MATMKKSKILAEDIKVGDQLELQDVTLDVETAHVHPDPVVIVGPNVRTGRTITRRIAKGTTVTVGRLQLNAQEQTKETWREVVALLSRMPYGGTWQYQSELRQALNSGDDLARVTVVRDILTSVNMLLRRLADEATSRTAELDALQKDMAGFRRVIGVDDILARVDALAASTADIGRETS